MRKPSLVLLAVLSLLLVTVGADAAMAKQPLTVELFYSAAWHDVTSRVYTRDPVTINHGAGNEQAGVVPSDASLTFDNRDGEMNPENRKSSLFGLIGRNTPIRIKVGTDIRFSGQVVSWKPRRAVKGDAWVNVTAQGTIRRLGQGEPPVRSAHTRTVLGSATKPVAYWPLEDPKEATRAASPISGVQPAGPITEVNYATSDLTPITPGGVPTFAANPGPAGSGSLASFKNGGTILAKIPQAPTQSEWTVEFVARWDPTVVTSIVGTYTMLVIADGTYKAFFFQIDRGVSFKGLSVFHQVDRDGSASGKAVALFDPGDGTPHHIRYTVAQDGANYRAKLYLDGNFAAQADNFGSAMAGTVGQPRSIEMNPQSEVDELVPVALGQVTVWGSETVPVNTVKAAFGYTGEKAGDRFNRLCTEEGITSTIVGTAAETQIMGPQYPDTILNLLDEVARTDAGIVHDTRSQLGLTFRTGRSLYNQ